MDQRVVVARLNIDHFRQLLTTEPEGPKRQTLLRLLAEEEAKLAAPTKLLDPFEKKKAKN